jgi:hypothetical protein
MAVTDGGCLLENGYGMIGMIRRRCVKCEFSMVGDRCGGCGDLPSLGDGRSVVGGRWSVRRRCR